MEASALVPSLSGQRLCLVLALLLLFRPWPHSAPSPHGPQPFSLPLSPISLRLLAQSALLQSAKKLRRALFGFNFKVKPRTKRGKLAMEAQGVAQVCGHVCGVAHAGSASDVQAGALC